MRLPTVRDNNAAELRAFDETCAALSGFDGHIDAEWVDGFLTALAAGPHLPPTEEWLKAMCGDAFERAFADPQAHDQALRAIKTRLAVLREQLDPEALDADPEAMRLNPLMSEWSEADRAAVLAQGKATAEDVAMLQTGGVWALGFLQCVEALPELWSEPEDEEGASFFEELYAQVEALVLGVDNPELAAHLARTFPGMEPTRDDLITQACFAVQDLRLFWVDRAPRPATRRVDKAPGRNDPCPCGSGKKYKKCHGSAAG